MFTNHQIQSILAAPGSYSYWCVLSPHSDPFWAHSPLGHVLHEVSDTERRVFRARATAKAVAKVDVV